jgi:hypothetical protein
MNVPLSAYLGDTITPDDVREAWASEHQLALISSSGRALGNFFREVLGDLATGRIGLAPDRHGSAAAMLASAARHADEGKFNLQPLEGLEVFTRGRKVAALVGHPTALGAAGVAMLGRMERAGLTVSVSPELWLDRDGLTVLIANPTCLSIPDPHKPETGRFAGRTGKPNHVALR